MQTVSLTQSYLLLLSLRLAFEWHFRSLEFTITIITMYNYLLLILCDIRRS